MFIRQIETKFTHIDKIFTEALGYPVKHVDKRVTTFGRLQNGDWITVDDFYNNDKITDKRFVIWNDTMQRIFNKHRKPNGKGFDIIW